MSIMSLFSELYGCSSQFSGCSIPTSEFSGIRITRELYKTEIDNLKADLHITKLRY